MLIFSHIYLGRPLPGQRYMGGGWTFIMYEIRSVKHIGRVKETIGEEGVIISGYQYRTFVVQLAVIALNMPRCCESRWVKFRQFVGKTKKYLIHSKQPITFYK